MTPTGTLTLRQPPISNGKIGMMLLVGSETVLFACFISAYVVLRMAAGTWPPGGTPVLTLGLPGLNTALLVLSSLVLMSKVKGRHAACLSLGGVFLLLQGVEFHRLYAQGLTLKTGPYGAVFYSLISLHGLHVLGGLGFLIYLLMGYDKADERAGYADMYWHFVTAVWLVLFCILYIL